MLFLMKKKGDMTDMNVYDLQQILDRVRARDSKITIERD